MNLLEPTVAIRQMECLAADLRQQRPLFQEAIEAALTPSEWASVGRVHLTGSGDSYHASCAMELAFETMACVSCTSTSSLRLLEYRAADLVRPHSAGRTLVIGTSSSGQTPVVVQALQRARESGALSLALTGTPGSPVSEAAGRSVAVRLPHLERSPGIRTYQASLLGLTLMAIHLGESRGICSPATSSRWRDEVEALADWVDATCKEIRDRCRSLAESIPDASTMAMVGSGPSYGTALFAAAKVMEIAGIPTFGQDLEEWWHVERFAHPADMPLFVIAPPGRSHSRAVALAERAMVLGRRVIAVTQAGDREVGPHASVTLPVPGVVREELSPFAYHLFAGYLACDLAECLGRLAFQGGAPADAYRPSPDRRR